MGNGICLRNFFKRREVRMALIAFVIIVFFMGQLTFVGAYLNLAFFLIIIFFILWEIVRDIFNLMRSLRMPIIRLVVRTVRTIRKELVVPPAIQIFYAIALIISIAITVLMMATKNYVSFDIGSKLVFSIIATAAFFDILIRFLRLMKKAWAKTVGKVLMANLSGIALLLALALAKQQIHALTRVDPKYFEDFSRLLAVLYLPFFFLAIGVFALSIFSIVQMFGVMIVLLVSSAILPFSSILDGSKIKDSGRILWYRIRHGRRPVYMPKKRFMSVDDICFLMRPIGTLALVSIVAQVISNFAIYLPKTQNSVAYFLAIVQYQSNSRCKGLAPETRVVYLDRGNIATAKISGKNILFDLQQCKTE